jgi:dTDP-4-dehydrorhamnose 3,5-epimerase
MIEDVKIKKLKVIPDERGRLMEMFRKDDEMFEKFGQVYMTTTMPGAVKAWHYHRIQNDNFVCVKGMAKVVLFDSRPGSKTKGEINEFFIGEHNQILLHIPKNVFHGFKCVSENECIIINCPTEMYNYKEPDEYRLPADTKKIKYNWTRKDG